MKALPPWDARNRQATQPLRAVDPETGKPFARLTIPQKARLSIVQSLLTPLITGWLPRQLLKLLAPVSIAIGASKESSEGTVAFVVAGVAFVLEIVLSKLSRKWLKDNA